jgi:hypothetical protein
MFRNENRPELRVESSGSVGDPTARIIAVRNAAAFDKTVCAKIASDRYSPQSALFMVATMTDSHDRALAKHPNMSAVGLWMIAARTPASHAAIAAHPHADNFALNIIVTAGLRHDMCLARHTGMSDEDLETIARRSPVTQPAIANNPQARRLALGAIVDMSDAHDREITRNGLGHLDAEDIERIARRTTRPEVLGDIALQYKGGDQHVASRIFTAVIQNACVRDDVLTIIEKRMSKSDPAIVAAVRAHPHYDAVLSERAFGFVAPLTFTPAFARTTTKAVVAIDAAADASCGVAKEGDGSCKSALRTLGLA